jgi:hypothetical protein
LVMYLVSNQRYCLPMPFAHAFGAGPSRWASRMSLALELTCVLAGILLCAGIVRAQEGGDLRDLRVGMSLTVAFGAKRTLVRRPHRRIYEYAL